MSNRLQLRDMIVIFTAPAVFCAGKCLHCNFLPNLEISITIWILVKLIYIVHNYYLKFSELKREEFKNLSYLEM